MDIIDHVDGLVRQLGASDAYDLARFAGWALFRAATYPAVRFDAVAATDLARLLFDGETTLPDHLHLHPGDNPDQQAYADEVEEAAQAAVRAFTEHDVEAAAAVAEAVLNMILYATYPAEEAPLAAEMAAQAAMAEAIITAQPHLRVESTHPQKEA